MLSVADVIQKYFNETFIALKIITCRDMFRPLTKKAYSLSEHYYQRVIYVESYRGLPFMRIEQQTECLNKTEAEVHPT